MAEPRKGPSGPGTAVAGLIAAILVSAAALAWLHSAADSLYGYDGYFHIRYAEVLRSEGISRTFPWFQETFLRDRFADKGLLYHLLLIPFTFGDLAAGAKAAAILLGSVAIGVFYLAARSLRAPWPLVWALLLLGSSTAFLYRLGFTRPLVLAVALAVGGSAAIFRGNGRWSFAFAALYAHVHISWHLLPFIALLHDLHRPPREGGRRSFRISGWTWAGAAAGALFSPYFPNNLYLWWVQNVRVLGMAWSGPRDLGLGREILAGGSDQLLKYNLGTFLLMALSLYLIARLRGRTSPEVRTLLVVSMGFLALSMMSRRFIEFWTPFTVLLASLAIRDGLDEREEEGAPGGARLLRPAAAAGILLCFALVPWSLHEAREIVRRDGGPVYGDASEWMSTNVPPGEKIFQMDWDDFPQLFFFSPQFRYLLGLDPTFMYVTDPGRWRLWRDVTHADAPDLYTPIREDFGCRWVFAIPEAADFIRIASQDPRFLRRYEDPHATIFFLADGYEFVAGWRVTGWYPDPARRLFDVPLRGEPGFDEETAPEPEGPAAAGRDARGPAGFVDLAAATSLPVIVGDACAVAHAEVASPEATGATLGIATDDEYRIYLNGIEVASHSPLRNPRPGTPGGPPADLDDLARDRPRENIERAVPVDLPAGTSRITVKSCRVGEEFGFYLRIFG